MPGKFHGQRNLAGYRTWDHKELNRSVSVRALHGNKIQRLRQRVDFKVLVHGVVGLVNQKSTGRQVGWKLCYSLEAEFHLLWNPLDFVLEDFS